MEKYVISHKTEHSKNEPILDLIPSVDELFMKRDMQEINGENCKVFSWVDIHDCEKFKNKEEVEMIVETMPFKHLILVIDLEEKNCINCLRNCRNEEAYLGNLDANGEYIDTNCWFQEGQEYWNFKDEDCPAYIKIEEKNNENL